MLHFCKNKSDKRYIDCKQYSEGARYLAKSKSITRLKGVVLENYKDGWGWG